MICEKNLFADCIPPPCNFAACNPRHRMFVDYIPFLAGEADEPTRLSSTTSCTNHRISPPHFRHTDTRLPRKHHSHHICNCYTPTYSLEPFLVPHNCCLLPATTILPPKRVNWTRHEKQHLKYPTYRRLSLIHEWGLLEVLPIFAKDNCDYCSEVGGLDGSSHRLNRMRHR